MNNVITIILVIAFIAFYWYTDKQIDETTSKLEEQVTKLVEVAQQAKFTFYYIPTDKTYGAAALQEYLQSRRWKEGLEKEFDCSQMSAYLEWKLENEGFHTIIVGGDSPDGSGRHAWLLVETIEGKYTPVEATARSIVDQSSPYFDNYFRYEFYFETIQEAVSYSPTEFEWWK